jgi:hypothetical protein
MGYKRLVRRMEDSNRKNKGQATNKSQAANKEQTTSKKKLITKEGYPRKTTRVVVGRMNPTRGSTKTKKNIVSPS